MYNVSNFHLIINIDSHVVFHVEILNKKRKKNNNLHINEWAILKKLRISIQIVYLKLNKSNLYWNRNESWTKLSYCITYLISLWGRPNLWITQVIKHRYYSVPLWPQDRLLRNSWILTFIKCFLNKFLENSLTHEYLTMFYSKLSNCRIQPNPKSSRAQCPVMPST